MEIVLFSRVLARIDHSSLCERIVVLSGEIHSKATEHFLEGVFVGTNGMKQRAIL
jgi:hypothetical protein